MADRDFADLALVLVADATAQAASLDHRELPSGLIDFHLHLDIRRFDWLGFVSVAATPPTSRMVP
jgi:hypothetical protein